jgi:hypothetical protein
MIDDLVVLTSRWLVPLILVLLLSAGAYFVLAAPPGPRSLTVFDPDRLAALEVDMWQAYYRKERVRLFGDLVMTLREQYRYSWVEAVATSFYLARAASTFAEMRERYERVIPDLESAYARIRSWVRGTFDPAAVARAELAWWTARRVDGQNSPEQVGRLIAVENGLLFNVPVDRVLVASTLRARAGRLRDEGGTHADWTTVSQLLHEAYRQLHAAVNSHTQTEFQDLRISGFIGLMDLRIGGSKNPKVLTS